MILDNFAFSSLSSFSILPRNKKNGKDYQSTLNVWSTQSLTLEFLVWRLDFNNVPYTIGVPWFMCLTEKM